MIVLVTGGRDYRGAGLIAKLEEIDAETRIEYLVVGCARGADAIAFDWGTEKRNAREAAGEQILLPRRRKHFAKWDELGKRAGPERNGRMVADAAELHRTTGLPVVCLAAPGGKGTENCKSQARAAGIKVVAV